MSLSAPSAVTSAPVRGLPSQALRHEVHGALPVATEQGCRLVDVLRLQPGERVLDVGCGSGLAAAWAAQRVAPLGAAQPGEVIGIDPLPLHAVLAARRHPRLAAQVGRAEDLSAFRDASFDVVMLSGVRHWQPMQAQVLAQARRVLKPGGRLGVRCADGERPHDAQRLLRQALAQEGLLREPGAASGVSGDQLQRWLEDSALIGVQWHGHTFVDSVQDPDPLLVGHATSYGNYLSELEPEQLARVRRRVAAALEAQRTAQGITLQRHLLFATALRPSYSG